MSFTRNRDARPRREALAGSFHPNAALGSSPMTVRQTGRPAYHWLPWAAVVAWATPIIAIGCAQFLRGTYLHGEYLNPRDCLEIDATVAGWCVAVIAFAGVLAVRSNMPRRYALWSLILSGVYALAPLLFAAYFLLSILLHKFPL